MSYNQSPSICSDSYGSTVMNGLGVEIMCIFGYIGIGNAAQGVRSTAVALVKAMCGDDSQLRLHLADRLASMVPAAATTGAHISADVELNQNDATEISCYQYMSFHRNVLAIFMVQ